MHTKLEIIVRTPCDGSSCPTIYRKDEDTFIIQGYVADGLFSDTLPDGEQAVAVPASLIEELASVINQ